MTTAILKLKFNDAHSISIMGIAWNDNEPLATKQHNDGDIWIGIVFPFGIGFSPFSFVFVRLI